MSGRQRDVKKERYWAKVIGEAARSGQSIRAFCRENRLKESQFYWWQRKLRERSEEPGKGENADRDRDAVASFALVSEEPGQLEAGIELVFADGRRLRIGRGGAEATLRTVLTAVESHGC